MRLVDTVKIFIGFWLAVVVFSLPITFGWIAPISYRRVIFYLPWLIFARGVCEIFRIERRISGLENIKPGFHRRHLFICNHQSALDIPLLVSIYPLPFLTKRENLFIPFVGLAGLLAGSISFDRKNVGDRRRVIKRIVDRAARHTSLYIFPEGTRSRTGEIQQRIYPALLRAAWRSGIDVVPIAVEGSIMVVNHRPPAVRWGRYPVAIKIGPAVEASCFTDDRTFAEYCWQQVVNQHTTLKSELAPNRQEPAVTGD
jgi:1-acyl-sn-glycerol-3-phosphate acyltransferase